LVVDRYERFALQPVILDIRSGGHRTDPDAGRGPQPHRELVPRLVPDLELVLGHVGDAIADDLPVEVGFEPARGDLPARVDPACQGSEIAGELRRLLAGV